jgi:hypothetical protein
MFEPLSIRYESTLKQYRDMAMSLKSELLSWSSGQPETTRARTLEHFMQPYVVRFPGAEDLTCPITRADIYSDCEWINCKKMINVLLTYLIRFCSMHVEYLPPVSAPSN